jgi:O-antigen biosynthesis protein WbqP
MKRIFDLSLGVAILVPLVVPMLFISITVRLSSKGSALYWSDRIGKNNKIFKMPKFRSMLKGTPAVATHLLDNPESYLSPIGGFLRRTSLDE